MKQTPPRPKSTARAGWARQVTERAERPLHRVRFARSADDAVIGGVAGGLAARWGIEPMLVRIAFVVLAFAGAVGVVIYLGAWGVSMDPDDPAAPPRRDASPAQTVAFGLIVLGAVLSLRSLGVWLGDAVGVPLLIGAVGAAVVYTGTGRERRARRSVLGRRQAPGRPSVLHLIAGGVLVVGGVVWFLLINRSFQGIIAVVVAVAVTTMGLAIVFGPWVYRLVDQLGEERRDRIRSEERAELAAHLHDSVLQTLALIQRNASSPKKMSTLARRQERELRTWLYGQPDVTVAHLSTAVQEMAGAIEESYEIPVDTVLVGDRVLDDRLLAVVHASREAATNAARHSGADEISVYVEVETDKITAFIRDRGRGFDPLRIPEGHRGITDSIKGRVERQGGTVTITSAEGEGCEVQITMPVTT